MPARWFRKKHAVSSFRQKYDPGYFINADKIERQLKTSGLIDLDPIGISAHIADLNNFKKTAEARSLIKKAIEDGNEIDIDP